MAAPPLERFLLFINFGQFFGHFDFLGKIPQPLVHHPLALRRAGAVHALHETGSTRHVFNETQNLHPCLGRNAVHAGQVFLHILADLRTPQVPVKRHGCHDAPGHIMRQAGNLVNVTRDVVLRTVGQKRIRI